MLFRVLQRDCQELLLPNEDPTFLAVYFPVRDSEFLIEELGHFQSDRQRNTISESHLSLLIAKQLLLIIKNQPSVVPCHKQNQFIDLLANRVRTAYRFSRSECPSLDSQDFLSGVKNILQIIEDECQRIIQFVCRRLYVDDDVHDGPLFLFDTLLAPVADFFLTELGVCLYFLIDDGDDLPRSHTIVLNTWISRRRKSAVFKVSTMYAYKTFETRSGAAIQQPHDFLQYDIATRYLDCSSEDYVELLRQICCKRLRQADCVDQDGEVVDPDEFFPRDEQQDYKIKQLTYTLTQKYEKRFEGRAIRDNVYRHSTSEYMRYLNKKRSLGSYRYAGFKTLAILSGGLVRDFIICAQRMVDDASRASEEDVVLRIPPRIQNIVVRAYADRIRDEIRDAKQKRIRIESDWHRVANILEGLGALFKQKMLSSDSERRVFSFAFQSAPSEEITRLLTLAICEGYLMKGYISKKEGTGRRALYVLTRRLAPAFSLDVSAYSGYLSCTPEAVEKLAKEGSTVKWEGIASGQMDLFDVGLSVDSDWVWTEPDGQEVW